MQVPGMHLFSHRGQERKRKNYKAAKEESCKAENETRKEAILPCFPTAAPSQAKAAAAKTEAAAASSAAAAAVATNQTARERSKLKMVMKA